MNTYQPEEYLKILRGEINAALEKSLPVSTDCPERLRSAMQYSLSAKGKRLRPLFVLLAAEVCGGTRTEAVPAAIAVEMIHTYSLIHDDLPAMDNDDLRRGRPTCHRQFDEATAILAGDALLTLAFEIVASELHEKVAASCCRELARAVGPCGMVGGQQDDMLLSGIAARYNIPGEELPDDQAKEAFLNHIHHRKTAALIRVSLRLGAMVAGATDSQQAALDRFGSAYGLAFQITDDILDDIGDEKEMGKRLHKDAGQGKLTFVTLTGLEKSRERACAETESALTALAGFSSDLPATQTLQHIARTVLNRTS